MQTTIAWIAASRPNAIAVADQEVEARHRERHLPLERPAGALAEHRDRGDQEHDDEREQAAERDADRAEDARLAGEHVLQQHEQEDGDDEEQRDRARVAADLPQHPPPDRPRDARRSCRGACSMMRQERPAEVGLAGLAAKAVGCRLTEDRAFSHQQDLVALRRLVHHVARDQQRGALARELGGTSPTAPPGGPDRGRPSARRARARPVGRAAPSRARPGSADRPTARRRHAPRTRPGRPSRPPRAIRAASAPTTEAKNRRFSSTLRSV